MNETVLLLARVVLYFFVYGCVGWGVEVAFAAVTTRQLVNRGFLNGPICPIYGFGMVALVTVMQLLPKPEQTGEDVNTVLVFFVGMFITTLIELVGGWVLFKLFHTRWWDYSMYRFNLGGYICPQFSLLWGLGSVLMVKVVHPLVAGLSMPLPGVPLLQGCPAAPGQAVAHRQGAAASALLPAGSPARSPAPAPGRPASHGSTAGGRLPAPVPAVPGSCGCSPGLRRGLRR